MEIPLQILWIDQAEADMLHTINELRARTPFFTALRIGTPAELRLALSQNEWTLLLVGDLPPGLQLADIKAVLDETQKYPTLILLGEMLDPESRQQNRVFDYASRHDMDRLAFILNRECQRQEVMQASQEQFRALIENSPDVVALVDADGLLLYGNKSAEQVLGFTVEELLGRSFLICCTLKIESRPKRCSVN